MDEVDKRAIAAITVFCPNLVKFGLINCEFTEIRGAVDEQGWEMMRSVIDKNWTSLMTLPWAWQFGNQLLLIYRAEDIEASPLLDLEVIKIVSDCNEEYVSFILGAVMSSHFNNNKSVQIQYAPLQNCA